MRISPSKYDVALTAVGLGLVSLHTILFILYLLLRATKRDSNAQKAIAKKTDRPQWVSLVILSGCMWILGSLQSYGIAQLVPDSRWTCACVKYGIQFTLGFVLWQSAVVYRMVRLFVVYTVMAKRHLHALIVLLILVTPYVVLTAVAIGTAPRSPHCVLDKRVLVVLYSLLAIMFTLYVFLTARLLAVMGVLRGMRRYILLTGLAFTIVPLDAAFTLRLGGNVIYKRVLMVLVIVMVSAQTWLVFASILRRSKATPPDTSDDPQVEMTMVGGDGALLPPKLDLFVVQERARRRRRKRDKARDTLTETMGKMCGVFGDVGVQVDEEAEPDEEVDERVCHHAVPDQFVIYTPPLVRTAGGAVGKRGIGFTEFVKRLHVNDRERVDGSVGVYQVSNMYCAVTDDQVSMCLKYLGP